MTDTQTHTHRHMRTAYTALSIASCGKNDVINEEEELTSAEVEEDDGEIELGGYPSSP